MSEVLWKNNLEIAKFLGCYTYPSNGGYVVVFDEYDYCSWKDLKYHEDWYWLLEVVTYLESQDIQVIFGKEWDDNTNTLLTTFYCEIRSYDGVGAYKRNEKTRLDAVYNTVLEFINIYGNKD